MFTRGDSGANPRFISNAPGLGFVAPFDGFRGIGVLLVVVVHGTGERLAGLAALVDIFFIISGFLITTLLLQEDRSNGRIDMREFFFRRVIRLFPVMYTVLLATLIGGLLIGDAEFRQQTVSDVLSAATYMYHVVHPVNEALLTGGHPESRPLIQLWSLSVEEHFYLFGALITVLALKFRRTKELVAIFLAFWLFVTIARATDHVGFRMMWYQRPDAIALGVALAYINAYMPAQLSERATKRIQIAGGVGFIVMLFTMLTGTVLFKPLGLFVESFPPPGESLNGHFLWGKYGYSVANFAAAFMVLAMVRGGDYWMVRSMSMKWARAVGRRSYVIYLIHFPLAMLLDQLGSRKPALQGLSALAYIPLLIVFTEVLHRHVELRAMRYFRDLRASKRVPNANV